MLLFECSLWILLAFAIFGETKSHLAPTVQLNNGYKIPIVGAGTYLSFGNEVEQSVKDAIDVGYRHFDTAYVYENEAEVGKAIREKIEQGLIKREDIFVTTKLWNTFHEPELVEKAFNRSLENLNLGYIDLYLIHSPIAFKPILKDPSLDPNDVDSYQFHPKDKNGNTITIDVDYLDTWRAMEKLVDSGCVRSIGISNFNEKQIERILSITKIVPVTNQVECNPRKNQLSLIRFCSEKNITVTAHTPLGRPKDENDIKSPISDPKVLALAQKYDKTPAQIVLRYTIQNGAFVIPKSTKKYRLMENFNLFNFKLSDDDMQIIHSMNNN